MGAERARGVTYLELIAVATIMMILASAILPMGRVAVRRQREIELRRDLRLMRDEIDRYKLAVDQGQIGATPRRCRNCSPVSALRMFTGVMCIYIVLVLLFKDFMQPATILWALILSIPGAFLALFLTHTAISMPSMIGIIMLMGIATKNSILLVEYAIVSRRERGMDRAEALLDACKKRARPIVMTTLGMGAGMLPVALGIGADPSFRSPMAIVVIGGLITSTFLSLLVIPVVFTYVDDWIEWAIAKVKKLRHAHA